MTNALKGVTFTRQQVEWLDKTFPEVAGSAATSDAELRFRSGQRNVIHQIREKLASERMHDGITE